MKIAETIFDRCLLIENDARYDARGQMEINYRKNEIADLIRDFEIKEQRIYRMPLKGTFFGIHFQDSQAKLVSVIAGKGIDYIVDLRKESETYKQYRAIGLSASDPKSVYIAAGFGHAFLSLEDNTIQLFAVNDYFCNEQSGIISYMDPGIGLKLPFDDIIIADKDRNAGYIL